MSSWLRVQQGAHAAASVGRGITCTPSTWPCGHSQRRQCSSEIVMTKVAFMVNGRQHRQGPALQTHKLPLSPIHDACATTEGVRLPSMFTAAALMEQCNISKAHFEQVHRAPHLLQLSCGSAISKRFLTQGYMAEVHSCCPEPPHASALVCELCNGIIFQVSNAIPAQSAPGCWRARVCYSTAGGAGCANVIPSPA